MRFSILAALLGALLPAVWASDSPDLEARVQQLEQQLSAVQNNQLAASPAATQASASSFNPAASLILSGTYAEHSGADDYSLAGFHVGSEGQPKSDGFALGESELTLSANVDDKFYGQFTISFSEENGETKSDIEESYIETSALADGLNLRFGHFLSGVGYLNSHHAHTDIFIDRPLVYGSFFNHHYGDDGVQLRYVLPLDKYLEVGAEFFRGDNYPAAGAANNGRGVDTQFIRFGDDIGIGGSYLLGLSRLHARADNAEETDSNNPALFTGDITITIVDATFKWSPQGNKKLGQFVVRSELFAEQRDGVLDDTQSGGFLADWSGKRNGYYVEGEYITSGGYEFGGRWDELHGDSKAPALFASDYVPQRISVMAGWRNSEFSRIQLQWSRTGMNESENYNSWLLQYQMSLGAHGAHKF